MALLTNCHQSLRQLPLPNHRRRKSFLLPFVRTLFVTIFLVVSGLLHCICFAQQPPKKHEIEAAFLYNFAKFIEWPATVFTNDTQPIIIGILGANPFGSDLERTIGNQLVNGRKLEIKRYENLAAVGDCQILFISLGDNAGGPLSASDKRLLTEVFSKVGKKSILTVGEAQNFAAAGGIINFVMEKDKIRFQINPDAAERANLKISSKLLNLAYIVHDESVSR